MTAKTRRDPVDPPAPTPAHPSANAPIAGASASPAATAPASVNPGPPAAPGRHAKGDRAQSQNASNDPSPAGVRPTDSVRAVKHFVLDTNVLLHSAAALFVFEENHVVIPYPVIEELDAMKRREDDVGRNARACIRHLDRLRELGTLTGGVEWSRLSTLPDGAKLGPGGASGTIRIDTTKHKRHEVIAADKPDNHIIACAHALHQHDVRAVFVSKDLGARIKSDTLGIRTEDFENQKVDAERLYAGFSELSCDGRLIDKLYQQKALEMRELEPYLVDEAPDGRLVKRAVQPNEFLVLRDAENPNHTGLARRLATRMADTDTLIPVSDFKKPVYGIVPRNVQQKMALDLLLDDEVRLVTLLGSAGTGKTLLAVAAGMSKVFGEERFEKLLVARPIMPMGRDIGYLPGDKDEKLSAWMQPIFDNLTYLLSTRGSPNQHADSQTTEQRIERLMADGKLVLEPLTYIRGRSIPHQFMIVDEAQNLTPHEVKTIVSRVGEGTKIVLTGDIEQIDNPYLDQSSNGLSFAVEKMKGVGLVGHIVLARSERSELASLAADLL
ncbi:MAG: PhoH family protein [Planctomycetota bacterium]